MSDADTNLTPATAPLVFKIEAAGIVTPPVPPPDAPLAPSDSPPSDGKVG